MTDSAIELGRIARLAGIHSVGTFERRDSDVGVAILAHLQSTGRLIPPGGMALTAEQVEDVRKVAGEDEELAMTGEFWAARDRLCALFPATEPAEEDTKAETAGERDALAMWLTGYGLPDLMAEGIATALLNDYQLKGTASSAVVPDSTETEWQTVEAIPEGVEFRGTFSVGYLTKTVWVKRDSIIWHSRPGTSHKEPLSIRPFAPFVAAEEG